MRGLVIAALCSAALNYALLSGALVKGGLAFEAKAELAGIYLPDVKPVASMSHNTSKRVK